MYSFSLENQFNIEAKSEKSKENMKNKIKKELKNILKKSNLFLEYDKERNSFSEMFERKINFNF